MLCGTYVNMYLDKHVWCRGHESEFLVFAFASLNTCLVTLESGMVWVVTCTSVGDFWLAVKHGLLFETHIVPHNKSGHDVLSVLTTNCWVGRLVPLHWCAPGLASLLSGNASLFSYIWHTFCLSFLHFLNNSPLALHSQSTLLFWLRSVQKVRQKVVRLFPSVKIISAKTWGKPIYQTRAPQKFTAIWYIFVQLLCCGIIDTDCGCYSTYHATVCAAVHVCVCMIHHC